MGYDESDFSGLVANQSCQMGITESGNLVFPKQ